MTNWLRKNAEERANGNEEHPSVAKARTYFATVTARLKPCPFKSKSPAGQKPRLWRLEAFYD